MVISISPFLFILVSIQNARGSSASDLLPISACSSSQLEFRVRQSKPSVLEVLETKLSVQNIEVVPKCTGVLQDEKISYSQNKNISGLGWIRAIWTLVDLLLGQFVLTPVSGASVTWSRTIPTGTLRSASPICNSMRQFRQSLAGYKTTALSLTVGATHVKCSVATIAKQISDAFASMSPCTFSCNGNSWSVGKCGNGAEIAVSMVSSIRICSCDSHTVRIRPCINNKNWGGVGTKACSGKIRTTFSITAFDNTETLSPTAMPTESPAAQPTTVPTQTPTIQPTTMPTETPTIQPTTMPTETPTIQPTTMPTETPTIQPTTMPTQIPSDQPTSSPTNTPTVKPTVHADLVSDFNIIDKNGDGSLNYDEIAFAIADANKDNKLSLKEYEAARVNRIFIDTKYSLTNSSVVKFSDVNFIADFQAIDKNGDGFLNYDEIAFAIVDIKKDGRLSLEEYETARADRIFVDTSYKLE